MYVASVSRGGAVTVWQPWKIKAGIFCNICDMKKAALEAATLIFSFDFKVVGEVGLEPTKA